MNQGCINLYACSFELGRKHSKCTCVNWKQTLSAIVSASQSFMGCIHLHGENCISHIRRIIQVSVEYQREIIPDVVRKMDRVIKCGWQGFISNDREMQFELRNFTVIWMEPSMRGKLRVGQLIEGLIESQRRFWETRELASFSSLNQIYYATTSLCALFSSETSLFGLVTFCLNSSCSSCWQSLI